MPKPCGDCQGLRNEGRSGTEYGVIDTAHILGQVEDTLARVESEQALGITGLIDCYTHKMRGQMS